MPTSGPEALLAVENLVVGYGDIEILHGVSMDVPPGGITTIIGPNGAGKSTLLRAIFGLLPVRAGHVRFSGQDVTNLSPVELIRRGLAYVGQGRMSFPAMTVRENLEMGAFTRRDRDVARDIDSLMSTFPVLGQRHRDPAGNLSGGEQQILEMAMALLLRPRLLLLDEPSLGLAPLMVASVFEVIGGMRTTVLMVEQNAAQALEISHHAVVLEMGLRRNEGPAADIRNDPEIRLLFLGGAEA
jgi:branched-chain amino acid transport system ATP-binding protein